MSSGKRVFRILARVSARIYWCDQCNLPLLTRVCGACSGEGRPLKLTPPADARPALGADYVGLWRLIEGELGAAPYPRRRVVLLNKVPYPDSADEVVIDGYIVGHRYFNIAEGRWRFKPLYVGVSELLRRRVGYYALVDLPALARNYEVHPDRVVEGNLPPRGSDCYVAVGALSGLEGLGVYTKSGRIRILKSWRAKPYRWNSQNPTWLDAVRANEARLALLEQEAVEFLRRVASRAKLPPFVSFSGGKDSLVAYAIAEKALGRTPILFNDTGLELPETVEYVKRFASLQSAELILASASDAFWRSLRVMGPPARDYRWCCKVVKLVPTAIAVAARFRDGALSIVGQRKMESAARALSPRVYRNKWLRGVVVAAPINDWTALDVWLYILRERVQPNPLYFRGFDRLGCWLCPAIELGEARALESAHPELWEEWESYLRKYSEGRGLPAEWVSLGLWRWLLPPGDIMRVARGAPRAVVRGPRVVFERRGDEAVAHVELRRGVSVGRVAELLSTIGEVRVEGGGILLNGYRVRAAQLEGLLKVSVRGEVEPESLAAALLRATACLSCESCKLWCPRSAVRVLKGLPRLDALRCAHCGLCNKVCPLAEYALRAVKVEAALRPAQGG